MTDQREIAHRDPGVPMVRQSDNLLAQVIAAAQDPNVDAAKMETLARLVNSQQDRERELEFNQDFNAAQMEMPVITRDGVITIPAKDGRPARQQGRFSRYEDIDRVVRPILQRRNIAIRFEIGDSNGAITVRPILSHANGYTVRGEAMRLPADTSGSKNATQAVGSATSYGKRYTMCAMLNIITEGVDDDGNMGRNTTVALPFEREQVVREEAERAIEEGRYLDWFKTQSPKDRGWLVDQTFHVEHGGQPRIAAPAAKRSEARQTPAQAESTPARADAPPPVDSAPDGPPAGDSGPTPKRTPEQLCADFESKIDGIDTSRAVIDYQAEPKVAQWMGKLQDARPDLHQRIVDHAARRYSTLVAKEREAARSGGGTLV